MENNKDVYGTKIVSTYTKTPDEIKRIKAREKKDKENQELAVRKLESEPTSREVMSIKTDILPVETRLLTNAIEISQPDYKKNNDVVKQVRLNNVHSFYKQINHNLIIGAKALYLVCRDLYQAKHALGAEDFSVLSSSLPMSNSTISKYVTIAESDVCKQLYIKGQLPDGWTVMYEIAKVEEIKVKEDLIKNVTSTSTIDQIWKMIGKVFKNVPPKFMYDLIDPKEFIKIAFEKGKDDEFHEQIGQPDPIALLLVKEKVEQAVKEAMEEYKEKYAGEYGVQDVAPVEVSFHEQIVDLTKKSMGTKFIQEKKPGNASLFHLRLGEITNTLKNTVLG